MSPKKRKLQQTDRETKNKRNQAIQTKVLKLESDKTIPRVVIMSTSFSEEASEDCEIEEMECGPYQTYLSAREAESSPLKSVENLCYIFQRTINFVNPSRVSPMKDINFALQAIAKFGEIDSIQDHWAYSGSPKQPIFWKGALVTYHNVWCHDNIFKHSFHGYSPDLLAISVSDQLYEMAEIESSIIANSPIKDNCQTTILIYGLRRKKVETWLVEELQKYGNYITIKFFETMCVVAVTYRYTVEAFAVALGLDGKVVSRKHLAAYVLMGEKEFNMHYKLFSKYC